MEGQVPEPVHKCIASIHGFDGVAEYHVVPSFIYVQDNAFDLRHFIGEPADQPVESGDVFFRYHEYYHYIPVRVRYPGDDVPHVAFARFFIANRDLQLPYSVYHHIPHYFTPGVLDTAGSGIDSGMAAPCV